MRRVKWKSKSVRGEGEDVRREEGSGEERGPKGRGEYGGGWRI